jgi:hypothetical protein
LKESLAMSIRSLAVLAAAVGLVVSIAPHASAQLTLPQVTAISRCQDTIARETRMFARKSEEAFEGCAIAKLKPVLKDDNGLITPQMFDTEDTRATQTCNRLFSGLGMASTRYVNAIIRSCGPVESLIMAPDPPPVGDPLGLVDAWAGCCVTNVAELAGALCGETLFIAAEITAFSTVPRGSEIASSDPGVLFPDIDPRCF